MSNAYKVIRSVTRCQLKLENNVPVHIKIVSKIVRGKELANAKVVAGEKKKEPPFLIEVINLDAVIPEGREPRVEEMIVNAVLKSNLEETYPKDSYVGKGFEVTKLDKRKGKEYNDFDLVEIEIPKGK